MQGPHYERNNQLELPFANMVELTANVKKETQVSLQMTFQKYGQGFTFTVENNSGLRK